MSAAPEPGADHVCDVAIVGGGMVGASLALALQDLPYRVALVEAVPPGTDAQPSFDVRTTALSNGTRRIFQGLGVWDEIARGATPIRRIHVSERGRFGSAVLSAEQQGVPALGYVAENRALGAALWRRLQAAGRTRVWSPATVTAVQHGAERVALDLATGASTVRLRARLVVAADGAQSLVRRESGVGAERHDYGQTALIANVSPARFHEHVAYERFTPTGPLALLPIADGRCVVVLTLEPAAAERALALDDVGFLALLQERFGWRLGRFTRVGRRYAYPLALTRAESSTAARVAIIGNAAQGLHPIAGQGFNLGLRDAATLVDVLADAATRVDVLAASATRVDALAEAAGEADFDPGAPAVLAAYADWRRDDQRAIVAFTDGLVRLFGSPLRTLGAARALGLLLFDVAPPAKSALARLSLGFAGRLPRLARGLPPRAAGGAAPP